MRPPAHSTALLLWVNAVAIALMPHLSLIAQETRTQGSLISGGLRPSGPLQPASLQPSGPLGGSGHDPSYRPSEIFWTERAERRREEEAQNKLTPPAVAAPENLSAGGIFITPGEQSSKPKKNLAPGLDLSSSTEQPALAGEETGGNPSSIFLKPSPGTFLGSSHNPALENLLFEGSVVPRSLSLPGDQPADQANEGESGTRSSDPSDAKSSNPCGKAATPAPQEGEASRQTKKAD